MEIKTKEIKSLVGNIPENFVERADKARLPYEDSDIEWNRSFYLDFSWLDLANKNDCLVKQLLDIQKQYPKHEGITLKNL